MPSKKKQIIKKAKKAKKHFLDGKPVYLGKARIVSSDSLPADTVELKDLDGCCSRGVRAACPACMGLEHDDTVQAMSYALVEYQRSLPLRTRIAFWFAEHDRLIMWLFIAAIVATLAWGN